MIIQISVLPEVFELEISEELDLPIKIMFKGMIKCLTSYIHTLTP